MQNLPSAQTPTIPVASQSTQEGSDPTPTGAFPTCGAAPDLADLAGGARPLTLVSQTHAGADGTSLDHSAADDDAFFTDLTTNAIVPLQIMNNRDETLTVASTGYARFVLVQDGRVVVEPADMPPTNASPTLEPGEAALVHQTDIAPCSGTELPDGDYEAYALLDAQVSTGAAGSDGEAEESLVYGGPWKIRFGESIVSVDAASVHCGEQISEVPRFNDLSPLDSTADEGEVQANISSTSENAKGLQIDSFETYLVADGTVVASATPDENLDLDRTAIGLADFPVPSVACDGETPVPPGDYQFFAVANYATADTDDQMDVILGAKDVTVTAK